MMSHDQKLELFFVKLDSWMFHVFFPHERYCMCAAYHLRAALVRAEDSVLSSNEISQNYKV